MSGKEELRVLRGRGLTARTQGEAGSAVLVEVLSVEGCPHRRPAIELVERLSAELGIAVELRLLDVRDTAAARRLRFLGSPTIRVGGVDVDPHSGERHDYGLSCRVYQTRQGSAGLPEERWVWEALQGASAIEAAAIDPVRCGAERTGRLSAPERRLYQWILERFAAAEPPSTAATAEHAASLGLDAAAALARLARQDLVHAGGGSIEVAYPFSARPRGHRVLIDDRLTVEAMCAIDALGIAPMLGLPIEVTSSDPTSRAEIWVRVDAGEGVWWEPQKAVVLAGCGCCEGPSYRGCCEVVNFFESAESAERYLHESADLGGVPISIPEAIKAGRAIFGDVLRGP